MLLNWHNYDSEFKGESPEKTAVNRLANEFLDNVGRYDIIRPLLDEQYTIILDEIKKEGNKLANELVRMELNKDDESKETNIDSFQELKMKYFSIGGKFTDELKKQLINN